MYSLFTGRSQSISQASEKTDVPLAITKRKGGTDAKDSYVVNQNYSFGKSGGNKVHKATGLKLTNGQRDSGSNLNRYESDNSLYGGQITSSSFEPPPLSSFNAPEAGLERHDSVNSLYEATESQNLPLTRYDSDNSLYGSAVHQTKFEFQHSRPYLTEQTSETTERIYEN